jgi:hypothetical protein
MAVVLIAVAATRRPASWWIGSAGAVAAAWIAVTWAVWRHVTQEGAFRLDPSYAWLWFLASFMEVDIGPGPNDAELGAWWVVADYTEVYPSVLLALGVYAVGYLVGVREHHDVPEPAVAV